MKEENAKIISLDDFFGPIFLHFHLTIGILISIRLIPFIAYEWENQGIKSI